MKKHFLSIVLAAGALSFAASQASAYEVIGQASIFWRDGEWQVYKDGHWIPYAESQREAPQRVEMEPPVTPVAPLEQATADANGYYYDSGYGYGYGFPIVGYNTHRHFVHRRIPRTPTPPNLNDRSIGSMGRTTIGIGPQPPAVGRASHNQAPR